MIWGSDKLYCGMFLEQSVQLPKVLEFIYPSHWCIWRWYFPAATLVDCVHPRNKTQAYSQQWSIHDEAGITYLEKSILQFNSKTDIKCHKKTEACKRRLDAIYYHSENWGWCSMIAISWLLKSIKLQIKNKFKININPSMKCRIPPSSKRLYAFNIVFFHRFLLALSSIYTGKCVGIQI